MGYTTEFEGVFTLNKPLTLAHFNYLHEFSSIRHMMRSEEALASMTDPIRKAVGLTCGLEGEYVVSDSPSGVIDTNSPPRTQPGLWCDWAPGEEGTTIGWNGSEKFYDYIEWLKYIIDNFLTPWGYELSGTVEWQGEHPPDFGRIVVTINNRVRVFHGKKSYEEERP